MSKKQENHFREQWPACLDAMEALYGPQMVMEKARYATVREELQRLRQRPSENEVQKALRKLWDFDTRFFGETGFNSGEYEWAVYSLCYLCKNETVIRDLLNIYVPLLGQHIQETLGADFRAKIGATFMDDVGHVLWDIEGLIEPEDHGLFDWHGNRNNLSQERIDTYLAFADLQPLPEPSFPPSWVLLHFTNLQDPFNSEEEYFQDLQIFYRERGYEI